LKNKRRTPQTTLRIRLRRLGSRSGRAILGIPLGTLDV
jgi:hypothetical protein